MLLCGGGIEVCSSRAKGKAENPALGSVQVQASLMEGSPLGFRGNQIPFLGGKWSPSWHLAGWGWGHPCGTGTRNSQVSILP